MSTPRSWNGGRPSSTSIGVKSLTRYADPSGDAFETLRKDGKALGLPASFGDRQERLRASAPSKAARSGISAEAQALVAALKGG